MSLPPILVWFRQDLRLTDNPALAEASASGHPILPLYILDDEDAGAWKMGGASRWWLHHSLKSLAKDLAQQGGNLLVRSGAAETVLAEVISETGAVGLYWNRRYEPWATDRDARLKTRWKDAGLDVRSFNGALLREPWTVVGKNGSTPKVYTPYWRALNALGEPADPAGQPAPAHYAAITGEHGDIDTILPLPSAPDWAGGLRDTWNPGEAGAHDRLAVFLDSAMGSYKDARNFPATPGVSRLSPHLHHGEISPNRIWHATRTKLASLGAAAAGVEGSAEHFLKELVWREFSHALLHNNPSLPETPLRSEFEAFPWIDDDDGLRAWQRGQTGYPIVDAGMRELWHTGYMHNRVRMIAASFLIKDLMIHWRHGEAWFWDTLVDADLASNAASWQWVAGCGADAAPFFRIFNPVLQGEKFDPNGEYVRRWVPEIARLPDRVLHKPWDAPALVLREAGITLGETYPVPIVDHAMARDRALSAFKSLKSDAAAA